MLFWTMKICLRACWNPIRATPVQTDRRRQFVSAILHDLSTHTADGHQTTHHPPCTLSLPHTHSHSRHNATHPCFSRTQTHLRFNGYRKDIHTRTNTHTHANANGSTRKNRHLMRAIDGDDGSAGGGVRTCVRFVLVITCAFDESALVCPAVGASWYCH